MTKNVPDQVEDKSLHIQESNQSSNGIDSKKSMHKYIITKKSMQKHNKQKISIATKGNGIRTTGKEFK